MSNLSIIKEMVNAPKGRNYRQTVKDSARCLLEQADGQPYEPVLRRLAWFPRHESALEMEKAVAALYETVVNEEIG